MSFCGGLILSAYFRQFLRILKMCGLVKSESLMSSTYFLYWLISVSLMKPREMMVSMILNGMDEIFKRLKRFPSLNRQAAKC